MTPNEPPPPFDDDELINDYYEEDGNFPEEYDEAFMEDFVDGDNGPKNNSNTAEVTKDTAPVVATDNDVSMGGNEEHEKHISNASEEPEDSFESADDRVPSQVFVSPGQAPKVKTGQDLYSFDRFNGGREWRHNLSEIQSARSDVMTAVQWKKSVTDNTVSNRVSNRAGSSAPEAQLVRFSTRSKASTVSNERFSLSTSLPVEDEHSVPITLGNGRMLYVRQSKDLQFVRSNQLNDSKADNKNGGLLGIAMKELTRRADAIERKNERKKRLKLCEVDVGNQHDETAEESSNDQNMEDQYNKSKRRNSDMDRLWIDKHAPAHFPDLLSDERVNREVLRALRQWDPYVFSREPPARPIIFQQNNNEQDGAKKSNVEEESSDKRPDENNRVILLSGPPGIGKTTLALIIARHAGYRPLEVNASDERSASVLTERVSRAMESSTLNLKRLSGKEDDMAGRPNCIILDEIDGADARSAIAALVNIIRAEKPAAGSKAKERKTYLRRPIIFICNHKHAPALRPLLPYARIFDVLAPSPNRLVSRLKAVLAAERMTSVGGSSMLHQLVEGASGDIRSCLYTLQFAAAKARETAGNKKQNGHAFGTQSRLVDISSALSTALGANGNGLKDERSDMAGTLMTIFRKLKSRIGSDSSASRRGVERVLGSVETFGDNSKTLDSLFLNILSVSYVDPTLDRCWAAHEWLSSSDMFRSFKTSAASNNSSVYRTMQKWHIPSAAAAVHILCRVETRPDLTLSMRGLNDAIYQLEANSGLIDKFLEGLSPLAKSGVNKNHFVSDVLPYCLWLLSAGNGNGSLTRPVSSIDILTKEERLAFDAHVKMLTTLGLTYVKDDDSEGEHNHPSRSIKMRLEPEIDKISSFSGLSKTRGVVPPLLKELLAHAATVAGMRANDKAGKEEEPSNKGEVALDKIPPKSKEAVSTIDAPDLGTKNNREFGKLKVTKKTNKAKTNFLGIGAAKSKAARNARKAALVSGSKNKVKLSNTGTGVPLDQVVRFKYLKGFTQAVRLPCGKNDLLL